MTTTHQPGDTTMEAHLSFKALRLILGLTLAFGIVLGATFPDQKLLLLIVSQVVSLLLVK